MLLVPIGRAGRRLTFTVTEPNDCAHCSKTQDFNLRLEYEWGSLFYVPVCVVEREYQLVCPECEHGWLLRRQSGQDLLGGDPIPWLHRNGWMILAAVALIFGTAWARTQGVL